MALRISLKPREKLIIGGAVVTNGDSHADLLLENRTSILRQKEILSLEDAKTACEKLYFAVQLMYIDPANLAAHQSSFWDLSRNIVASAPSTLNWVRSVSEAILVGDYYQALKTAKGLIRYEKELLEHASQKQPAV